MAGSPLESLPVEVFEAINAFLDLRDLLNVRLVSRSAASKATQNRFGSFLHSRRVEMTRLALQFSADLTTASRIGCFIEELTLVGVVYNTAGLHQQLEKRTKAMVGRGCEGSGMLDEPSEPGTAANLAHAAAELDNMRRKQADYYHFHESGRDVTLLTSALKNLAANTKRQGLASLSIDVVEYRQDTTTTQPATHRLAWRSVWRMAEETFHTFTVSLGAARLPIQELNLFCNDFSGHCSLQCNQLSRCDWLASGVAFTLANVESLSISISDRVLNETPNDAGSTGDLVERIISDADAYAYADRLLPDVEELKNQVAGDENFSGLVMLLNSCKKLRKLDLRRCYVRRRRSELNDYQGEKFLKNLVRADHIPTLQVLSLRNFVAREHDLMNFLKRHQVHDLTLVNISLDHGSWNVVFDYITKNADTLHLDDLSQDYQTILFSHGHEEIENSLIKGLRKSQNIYKRQSEDLHEPIAWRLPRYRRLGPDPAVDERTERTRNRFGPPAAHYPGIPH
ncbi:hypothetical protein M409DRAFT_25276 [Zasmidium cellare ATCC 36951]|uniref:F-box domain-containing protein n=1 Tax=Zasmidium cellare ATCC 36951 TaxID=1080233 RepID=A0A6A6CDZ8_ZASCE|nr:uncharacterized protein M409DRAFT_25276 [Zasmidium cellare ATCC 36951]KAF2164398.1 hypothetical protein M409DRAFT_25276 [Zasmidium cellare ATCC 36951]